MSARGKLKILIIDDDEEDSNIVRKILDNDKAGILIRSLQSGIDALSHLSSAKPDRENGNFSIPDVILLDINMPMLDGYEFLKEMRTLPRCRAIPVVFFTSSRNPQDIRRAYDSGAAGYIAKPFSLREYRSRLKGLVEYWTNTCLLPGRENT